MCPMDMELVMVVRSTPPMTKIGRPLYSGRHYKGQLHLVAFSKNEYILGGVSDQSSPLGELHNL